MRIPTLRLVLRLAARLLGIAARWGLSHVLLLGRLRTRFVRRACRSTVARSDLAWAANRRPC